MNDATNDTRPYPDNDPMRDLLGDRTEPLPTRAPSADAVDTEVIAPAQSTDEPSPPVAAWPPHTDAPAPAPAPAAAPAAASAPGPAATTTPTTLPTPPRASTIVWGCILFLIAAFAAAPALLGETSLSPTAILWTVVGFGALLVVGGIVGAIVGLGTRRAEEDNRPNL